ncbi:MAG: hypothetical protein HQL40_14405 [Alphaproteobacteria bacterium]|nr:hypothetical protein [Alphaproteobacteria bacterium]MBF0334814.1 hypothetical protein [Alphaproteobacteria bacterium]
MLDETTLETTNPLGTLRSLHAKRFTVFGDESRGLCAGHAKRASIRR